MNDSTGDSNAAPLPLEALFRQHSPYVAGIAFRMLGRDADISDVVQDVFLHAMSKLRGLRDVTAARAWLTTVTINMVRRRLRARRLRTFLGLETTASDGPFIAPGVPADDRVLVGQIYEALEDLPANERIAWSLRKIEGMPLDEVAAVCTCSLATAKRRIAAAQATLDEVLGHE